MAEWQSHDAGKLQPNVTVGLWAKVLSPFFFLPFSLSLCSFSLSSLSSMFSLSRPLLQTAHFHPLIAIRRRPVPLIFSFFFFVSEGISRGHYCFSLVPGFDAERIVGHHFVALVPVDPFSSVFLLWAESFTSLRILRSSGVGLLNGTSNYSRRLIN